MINKIHQPHDKLFKIAMEDIRYATEYFRRHLSKFFLDNLDFKSLELQKNSIIHSVFNTKEIDVVYKAKFLAEDLYLYIPCESEGDIKNNIAFRNLMTMVNLSEIFFKQKPKTTLPLVYSIVHYTGKKPWTAPRSILDFFGNYKNLAKEIILGPHALVDLHRIDDNELKKHIWSGLIDYVLKHKNSENPKEFFHETFLWLERVKEEDGENFAKVVLTYLIDTWEKKAKELLLISAQKYLTGNLKGEFMTIREAWIEEGEEKGIKKGIKQGIKEGIEEGMVKATKNIAFKLLKNGVSISNIVDSTGLSINELEALLEGETI